MERIVINTLFYQTFTQWLLLDIVLGNYFNYHCKIPLNTEHFKKFWHSLSRIN